MSIVCFYTTCCVRLPLTVTAFCSDFAIVTQGKRDFDITSLFLSEDNHGGEKGTKNTNVYILSDFLVQLHTQHQSFQSGAH